MLSKVRKKLTSVRVSKQFTFLPLLALPYVSCFVCSSHFVIMSIEQRTNIKFCVLLHKTPAETLRLLEEAYDEAAMKKTQVHAWHKRFSGGRDSIKDDVRSGRPTTATNEAIAQCVRNVVRDDRRKTIKEIAAEVGISVGSVHNVLHKHLNMHYVSQKLVPKMLSAEQKETRMTLAGDMISMADEDGDFLNKIIAGDETWCYLYDPVPKRQSSEWKSKTSPRKQKFPRDTSKGKVTLEVFFDSQGLIHHEFIPEVRTVTKELPDVSKSVLASKPLNGTEAINFQPFSTHNRGRVCSTELVSIVRSRNMFAFSSDERAFNIESYFRTALHDCVPFANHVSYVFPNSSHSCHYRRYRTYRYVLFRMNAVLARQLLCLLGYTPLRKCRKIEFSRLIG
ncbi:hypothetical protein ANN_20569 [Periplaneta americana]|uniref:Mos1 transposase HTH domain-containing protein n=1 Tax=Periplaneta americana TaxID=6978 RepID=A0ABQ8SDR2_PERAM|nr:hypothetical protein ANN_20569 [Periplaneta americana]